MPTIQRAVEVTLPEAEALADLYGIEYDLATASYLCAKALEMWESDSRDYLVIEALVSATIVRYARCFATGTRLGLARIDLAELQSSALSAHDYFKALRDKFVAHSINPFEETFVTASASERNGVRLPIESVNPGYRRLVLSGTEARELAQLLPQVLAIVRRHIQIEKEALLEFIKTLPLDAVHDGDLHSPRRFSSEDVNKSRKQSRPQLAASRATGKNKAAHKKRPL
ncbi:MAG: hypothetical protein ACT4P8_21710 [Betaproteobacteria bacterium]